LDRSSLKAELFGPNSIPSASQGAKLFASQNSELPTLPVALKHPELYENYPQLRNIDAMNIRGVRGIPYEAGYREPTADFPGMIDFGGLRGPGANNRSNILHEVQHAIQGLEGFAEGGNPAKASLAQGTPAGDLYTSGLADWVKKRGIPNEVQMKHIEDWAKTMEYLRTAGEVEARNVQERLGKPPELLSINPPFKTQDVPYKDQFLRWHKTGWQYP